MISVTIIGPGRVGGALSIALPKEKYYLDQIVGRDGPDTDPAWLSGTNFVRGLENIKFISSDLVFITTTDPAISDVAKSITGKLSPGSFVFHTSGALTSTVLEDFLGMRSQTGSIHPLVSVSKPELGPARFAGAYFCVEGTPTAVKMANSIVSDLGGIPFTVPTEFKTLYHAAAVMACGHLVALFDSAVEVLSTCGLSAERSKEILLPLVASTIENLSQQSPSEALTGTFARADTETFTRHLTTLNRNVSDDLLELYLLLGERSLQLAAKEGVNPERIDSMLAKMSVAKSRLKW
jgi:predicted short-subunit dehydrogenase-like oxidoreductase (DUF2520 family)